MIRLYLSKFFQLFYNPKKFYSELKGIKNIALSEIIISGAILLFLISFLQTYHYLNINLSDDYSPFIVFALASILGLFVALILKISIIQITLNKLQHKLSFKETSIIILTAMFANVILSIIAIIIDSNSLNNLLPYLILLLNSILIAFGINVYTSMNILKACSITISVMIIESLIFYAFIGMNFKIY